MYLKNIEIQGFKSFARKINLEFPEGITGIVGPNGSGKSNIADAVRWVLGEQKIKQLRGSKMEDVIFAGTANRKPLGFAMVSITFDNSDHKLNIGFEEVTVTRRVFRSGESEYLINGSACRLRDLQELFYDTGIGKEGYSIIGQGQIDKILQGKPEERREIFDEAAGIVKYKRRKTIALRKLENERLNISRVTDILKELSRQVGPLQRQAEAADKYVKLREELKKYDINFFLLENGESKLKIKEYEEKEAIARNDLAESQKAFENTKDEYEKISSLIAEIDVQILEIRDQISKGDVIKEKMEGQINLLNEQINSIKEAEKTYSDRYAEMISNIHQMEADKEENEAKRAENELNLEKAKQKKKELENLVITIQNRNEELRNLITESKEKAVSLIREKGEIIARSERLEATLEQIEERKEAIAGTLEQYNADKNEQENIVKDLRRSFDEAKEKVEDLEYDVSENESNLSKAAEELKNLTVGLEMAKISLVNDTAKLESLKNITERYEGYGNSIKEVMSLKEKNPGIHGVVADIIQTDKEYETAIEVALGGNIQNIVTDTENTAKLAIEHLKNTRSGRATFLPLEAVKGRGEFKNRDVLLEDGVIGLACDLVKADEKYKGVVQYLIGKVVVVDTIDHALAIAGKYNHSVLLVTLEGEYLNRGGALTGGAFKNKSNLLSRRREIEELEKLIAKAREKIDGFDAEVEKINSRKSEIESTLGAKREELQEARIAFSTLEVKLRQAEEKNEELEGGFRQFNEENRSIEEQKAEVSSEIRKLKESLSDNDQAMEAANNAASYYERELNVSMENEATELVALQDVKMQNLKLVEESSYLTNNIIKLETDLEKYRMALDHLISSNKNNAEQIREKEEEITRLKDYLASGTGDKEILMKKLDDLEAEKEARTSSHKEFIDKREEYASRVADLDKEIFRLTSLREKLEERYDNKLQYIWDEYELTFNSALEFKDESLTDTKLMKEKISEIKQQIKGLGVINVGAIEEYKEVKERYDFLKGQHEDLLNAEADLVKIIKNLDKEMRKQFNSEFEKIRREFGIVFKEMFGGGSGTIKLEEDVDVLDAGISIIAQPPGKKLQNMMQLSGGEKALTAIAVLFAIQNLKPSPFCILDEIEAALDDANIDRFAAYLKELSKGIQFIVITHRKGTMEAAHRLYGITMQEKGVSSLISVNLEDVKEEMLA